MAAVALATTQTALAQTQARVFYDNREVSYGSERPFGRYGTLYVPARITADRIGARIDRTGDELLFLWQNSRATYRNGSTAYVLNGRRRAMEGPSVERQGILYVPIDLFEQLTGGRFSSFQRRNDDWRDDQRFPNRGSGWNEINQVYWEGRRLDFDRDERPFTSGRVVMVPARATASKIGGRLERSNDGRVIRIEYRGDAAEYRQGTSSYRLNGRDVRLDGRSQEVRDVLFVPIQIFTDLTRGRLSTSARTDDWRDRPDDWRDRPGDWRDRPGNRDDDWRGDNTIGGGSAYYNGRRLDFSGDERPFRSGSTLLVPARAMASRIGADLDRTESGRRIQIEWQGDRAVYDQGSYEFSLDGRRIRISGRSQERDGVLFVPIEIFEHLTRGRVTAR